MKHGLSQIYTVTMKTSTVLFFK